MARSPSPRPWVQSLRASLLWEVFCKDFKSLARDAANHQQTAEVPQRNNSNIVLISTCFSSNIMHLELNSDINIKESSAGASGSYSNLNGLSESQNCLDKLEQIDPEYTKAKERDEENNDNDDPPLKTRVI